MPKANILNESFLSQKSVSENDLDMALERLNQWGFDARRSGVADQTVLIGRDPEQKIEISAPSISEVIVREEEVFIVVTQTINGASKEIEFAFTNKPDVLITSTGWSVALQAPL